ncbi:MAG: transcription termination/antitermination protein NusA, partial [Oscillospiraceae bacterium]|nr:transcription termination/antitermination protein NusA [Oscillospiraceae bacterium]
EVIFEALEAAMVAAYKKNVDSAQNVVVNINKETGEIRVFAQKEVVEFVMDGDKQTQISLLDAKEIDPGCTIGDFLNIEVTPRNFGRIAAMNAKQVVTQKIREAERGNIYRDYTEKNNDIVTGKIQRIDDDGKIFVDIGESEGKIVGFLPVNEQPKNETNTYFMGQRIRCYISEVKNGTKGPQILLSRTHPGLVKKLFRQEVPEIQEGIVEIKSIAREAGSRTKIAVYSKEPDVDPQGACIGPKGMRVQMIGDELKDEKIDIVKWSEDPAEFITASLSPAKVIDVEINEEEKSAKVRVPEYQLSLAIGKSGQNVRLAARLTGWKIDIRTDAIKEDEEEYTGNLTDEEIFEEDFSDEPGNN